MKASTIYTGIKIASLVGLGALFFYSADASAQSAANNLGDVANNIKTSFGALAQLVTAIAYVAGMGFALASILKFKAHKDNPTQIPIGTPIALLFVAAALLFLPQLFGIAGQTVFGSGALSGGISGVTS